MVADGDVILALSASGETEEMLRILPAIARFQVKIIAVCGDRNSSLAQNSHVFLDVNIEQEACPLNLAPTSSTTVMLCSRASTTDWIRAFRSGVSSDQ